MRRHAKILFIGITVVISMLGWGVVWAQGSIFMARYTVSSSSVSSGGGYIVRSTMGQSVTSGSSSSTFTVNSGYWRAPTVEEGNQIFLPMLSD